MPVMMHALDIKPASVGTPIDRRRGERGYTLVALLALITILLLMTLAAAPNIRQQMLRERENEAIFRGEEVAEAIRRYAQANNGQLPTSMDQLLEGISRGTKKVQILRPAAAKDPLTESGEWRLVRLNDPAMIKFKTAVTLYAGGRLPETREPSLRKYAQGVIGSITNINPKTLPSDSNTNANANANENTNSNENVDESASSEDNSANEDDSVNSTGPFIGVTSRSRTKSIINYYGIDRHDRWIFTPLFR
jgi:type II secretory pathway pseudopilin PulG